MKRVVKLNIQTLILLPNINRLGAVGMGQSGNTNRISLNIPFIQQTSLKLKSPTDIERTFF